MPKTRSYRVAIYNNHGGSKRHTNRPLAYLTYFASPDCVHEVQAASGVEAKRLAIREHKAPDSPCSFEDAYCDNCPGLGATIRDREI